MQESHSRWTMPLLRISMGLFLLVWGVDKIINVEHGQAVFSNFYGLDLGAIAIQAFGWAQILLSVALIVGFMRVAAAWIQLAVNLASFIGSWSIMLDPLGTFGLSRGNILFIASYVITAAAIVLVLNAKDDFFTLDKKLRGSSGSAQSTASAASAEGYEVGNG